MCGILGWFGKKSCPDITKCLDCLSARGPEGARVFHLPGTAGLLGFTRLAINGLNDAGMQPFSLTTSSGHLISWICNGEIYNAASLAKEYGLSLKSGSDCEVIGHLYQLFKERGDDLAGLFQALDGVFALVIYDEALGKIVWARDPYGVRPLFCGWITDKEIDCDASDIKEMNIQNIVYNYQPTAFCISSERKAFKNERLFPFQPGSYGHLSVPSLERYGEFQYHTVPWVKNPMYSPLNGDAGLVAAQDAVRFALEAAVTKRMMMERPVAALLSGGIDSSLIAALVQRNLKEAEKGPLKTFSIGMKGSTDLFYARKVADWIGSDHTEVILTADDFFEAIPHVIRDIESFDITTIRASVGNWLVSREISKRSDCKVVFNGDGSDEVFGSYLYFFRAPSDQAFESEVGRLLREIHFYDVLRSDRSISSHGLEPRTPFLDKQFVAVATSVATCWRRPSTSAKQVEKWLLRSAFDSSGLLPKEVIWRQKEAFSDGVSSTEKSWYQEIQDRVTPLIPSDWKDLSKFFNFLPPISPESYYYRILFSSIYGDLSSSSVIPAFWMPRWSPETKDPSARTLSGYSTSTSSSS